MPVTLSDPTVACLTLVIDPDDTALALQDPSTGHRLMEFQAPAPDLDTQWASSADTEGERRAGWRYMNRTVTAKVLLSQPTDALLEASESQLGQKIGTLQRDGGELELGYPSGLTITFDIEEANFRRTYEPAHVVMRLAEYELRFTCRPLGRGALVTGPTATGTAPFLVLDVPDVPGDVEAETIVVVTDSESKARRYLLWGAGSDITNANLIDSDSLVTLGGTQTTRAGAYDPGAAGNSVIRATMHPTTTAVCSTGDLAHVGSYWVFARVYADEPGANVRLTWQDKDGPFSPNPWVTVGQEDQWLWLDLGLIELKETDLGDQEWSGRIDAYNSNGGNLDVDFIALIPFDYGSGVSTTVLSRAAGVLTGLDDFTGTTAAAVLNGRTAELGGTWATTGVATDFTFSDDLGGEQVRRTTTSEASARLGVLGAANLTDTQIEAEIRVSAYPSVNSTAVDAGFVARYVDSSNYLKATLTYQRSSIGIERGFLTLQTVVGGVVTAGTSKEVTLAAATVYTARVTVYSSGRTILQLLNDAGTLLLDSVEWNSTVLATGGTLDDGKPGLHDWNTGAGASTRHYDEFSVAIPPTEDLVIHSGQEFRIASHGRVERANGDGTKYGKPSWLGHRIKLPPGDSRIVVAANVADLTTAPYDVLDDSLDVAVFYSPRYLNVPAA